VATRHSRAKVLATVGVSAFSSLAPFTAAATTPVVGQSTAEWTVQKSTSNEVGCQKTAILKRHRVGESRYGFFLFDRPSNLKIEDLTDMELEGCGLPPLGGIRRLPKTSSAYQSWSTAAQALLTAKQVDPREPAPLPAGHPPIPEPPRPSGGPWSYHHTNILDNHQNTVGSGGYTIEPTGNFSGREIFDQSFDNTGDAASPMASVTWITSPEYTLPASTPAGDSVATQIAEWIGYQDQEDSGTGGTSLAQIGVLDNVYTASTGGPYYRTLEPFVEYYPDPTIPLPSMAIQPSDTVSFNLDYSGSSSFSYSIMDSNAQGSTSLTGFVNLYRMKACAEGTSGSGFPITICNNGDVLEWVVEDHGQYTKNYPEQVNPATPAFGTIALQNAVVTWNDGYVGEPNNNTCTGYPLYCTELDLTDTSSSGQTLIVEPKWGSNKLHFPYSGPPYPGFNWPEF
jgi:hypothetical protein